MIRPSVQSELLLWWKAQTICHLHPNQLPLPSFLGRYLHINATDKQAVRPIDVPLVQKHVNAISIMITEIKQEADEIR